jgi:hypothetical protein
MSLEKSSGFQKRQIDITGRKARKWMEPSSYGDGTDQIQKRKLTAIPPCSGYSNSRGPSVSETPTLQNNFISKSYFDLRKKVVNLGLFNIFIFFSRDGCVRRGCRFHAADGHVFDADWNTAHNIRNRYRPGSPDPLPPSTESSGSSRQGLSTARMSGSDPASAPIFSRCVVD